MKSQILQLADHVLVLWAMSASAAIRYVNVYGGSPSPPYTNWTTAAATIQDAVDVAVAGDQILVTNGVYQTGGRTSVDTTTNRVTVDKPITLQSVNGAAVTLVRGFQALGTTNNEAALRCVYLASGAALIGFTLTNGATQGSDDGWGGSSGGVLCESASSLVSNCTLTANQAGNGGGAESGTLNNCTLTGNSASGVGGGAAYATLNNCTVIANSAAPSGGGVFGGILNNCIVYYNTAPSSGNFSESSLSYSCTTPLPTNGMGNLTNAPLFMDYPSGDLRLQSNSPCINSGSNAFAPAGSDLDGNSRIIGGTVDIGAYECPSPQSLLSYAWLQQYGLPTDGSADHADPDGDGMDNWQEWRAGTNPTKVLSVLRLLTPTSGPSGLIVSWQSVPGGNYFLERNTHLRATSPFLPLATGILGHLGTTTFTDTNAVGSGPFFYRVGVRE